MYSPAIILTLISVAYALSIQPYLDDMSKKQLVNEQLTDGVTSSVQNNSVPNNNPPPSSHTYPTYPEYSSNTGTVTVNTRNEGYLMPTTTAVQKTSRLSYESILSSLIPFVTTLSLYGARAGTFLLQFFLVILVGFASTSLICTYTSICYSFADKTENLARIFVTPENLDIASAIVGKALDKYSFI